MNLNQYPAALVATIFTGEFEGVRFKAYAADDPIVPGDKYLAARHDGVKLLTCKESDPVLGVIYPVETAYSYNVWECVRIELEA